MVSGFLINGNVFVPRIDNRKVNAYIKRERLCPMMKRNKRSNE